MEASGQLRPLNKRLGGPWNPSGCFGGERNKFFPTEKLRLDRLIPQLNLLTPNVNYSGRTAPLTSKVAFYVFIQQI